MFNLQLRDIVRHPSSGNTGMLLARGRYTADYQTADGVMYYVRLEELIPATYAEEAEYRIAAALDDIVIDGDIVRCAPDNALGMVLERTVSRVYVVGLYEGGNLNELVLGRDYWLAWMDVDACVSTVDDAFEADVLQVAEFLQGMKTAQAV